MGLPSCEAVNGCGGLPSELVIGLFAVLQHAGHHERMQHVPQRIAERVVRPEHPLDFAERLILEEA
jgi:hypothetical protein